MFKDVMWSDNVWLMIGWLEFVSFNFKELIKPMNVVISRQI